MSASQWNGVRDRSEPTESAPFGITDGEINFLWSFIQGSIMNPDTWNRLLNGHGFCERHAWLHISIEASFRAPYLLGPTILYQALIDKALHAIRPSRIGKYLVMQHLRSTDSCLLCALGIKETSAGATPQTRLDRGRDSSLLRNFAYALEPFWHGYVCDRCRGYEGNGGSPRRCRRHAIADMRAYKPIDLSREHELLCDLYDGVTRYQNSFLANGPEVDDLDRAALIGAIGWCSGWRPLLYLLQ